MKNNVDKSGNSQTDGQNVVELVDELLAKAVEAGASDIHFEPTSSGMLVKYRLDGVLNTVEKLPGTISDNMIARLKVLGGLLTYRNDIPQEGRLEALKAPSDGLLDQRLAVFPTINGQRAVVRLLYRHQELTDLQQLGFSDEILDSLREIADSSQGVLLLTGPAGSGKSTTLGALLRHILAHYPGKSVVSLEDPVEIRIDGATQVQIAPHGQMTFVTALRSLLRQDPEVLMIGEIRDAETARITIEAGLTGHLMMSTMHSGTCSGALLRLLEMGIEPYQVTSSIAAVLNQRLVRKLCDKCKKESSDGCFEAVGCPECLNTGYKGRVLIAEMVRPDSGLRKAILEKADLNQLEEILHRQGHTTMLDDGKRLLAEGITTPDELRKISATAV